jgi:tetratricopeptide (TPR) repeat protein
MSQRPYLRAAQLYALAGRPDRARTLLSQYATDIKDSALIRQQEPQFHNALAEIALAEHRPLDAVTEFRLGDQRPDGPADDCTPCLPMRLGRVYDRANMPDSAIVMYERYLATPSTLKLFSFLDPSLLAGIHKRLGELYQARGDEQKARDHYVKFLALWGNADPELQPKVAQVKQRLARLRDTERH